MRNNIGAGHAAGRKNYLKISMKLFGS